MQALAADNWCRLLYLWCLCLWSVACRDTPWADLHCKVHQKEEGRTQVNNAKCRKSWLQCQRHGEKNQPNKLVPPNQPVASSCCVDNSVQCHVSKYFSYSRPLPDIRRIVEPRQDPRSPFAYLSCYLSIYIYMSLSLSLFGLVQPG